MSRRRSSRSWRSRRSWKARRRSCSCQAAARSRRGWKNSGAIIRRNTPLAGVSGVVQPLLVRPLPDGGYELIAGERRWRAAQMAGIERIPAVVRNVTDEVSVAMALIENIQREDLNPLEEATALRRLIDDFQMTHQEAADSVGRSRAAVSNLLRLLELMQEVKDMVDTRLIEMGHARALLSLEDDLQVQAAREVVRKGLSVRQTENLVRRLQQSRKQRGKRRLDPDILRLQNRLSEALGARVSIQHRASGKGKLLISYNDADELDGILQRLDLHDPEPL